MPRVATHTPGYRLHKPTGQAVVRLNGRDFYLGAHGTPRSHERYDRLIAQWLSSGRSLPRPSPAVEYQSAGLTVIELIAAFWHHAENYYRKPDGRATSELHVFCSALRVLRRLFGTTSAADMGPKALKIVRDEMVRLGWCRNTVNKQVGRVRAVFKWGVEQEILPAMIYHALQAVAPLKRGRCDAAESDPVRPVADEHVAAVLPFLSRQVETLIQLQLLTGARPGELLEMRPVDLSTSAEVWTYTPPTHKTAHHGHSRTIYLGPKAQEVIKPFLPGRAVDAPFFSPREAEAERRDEQRGKRCRPMTPSQKRRHELAMARTRKRAAGETYDVSAYRRAIARACAAADVAAHKARPDVPADQVLVPSWHPHQLRHNAATNIRREFGIETARVILGHKSALVTEIYAEQDHAKAQDVIRRIG